jgi:hypothetical protein
MAEMKADWDAHVQEIVAKTASSIKGKMEAIVHSSQSGRDGRSSARSRMSWGGKRSLRKGPQWQVWSKS